MMIFSSNAQAATSFSGAFSSSLASWTQKGWPDFFATLLCAVIGAVVLGFFLKFLLACLGRLFDRSRRINALMSRFICKVLWVIGWIAIFVWFLGEMGVNVKPMITGLGVTGVIFGLAFKETITNWLHGAMIVINAPFGIGDYIEAGSYAGTVLDMDMICVLLKTPDNKKITLSNTLVWGSPIVNYSAMDTRRVDLSASVAYDTDLKQARDIIMGMLNSYPEVLKDPAPTVEVSNLAASSIDFVVRPWVKQADYWNVKWRFQGELVAKLGEKGIEVPFNQLDLHMKKD